jgi:hypothetical protein
LFSGGFDYEFAVGDEAGNIAFFGSTMAAVAEKESVLSRTLLFRDLKALIAAHPA